MWSGRGMCGKSTTFNGNSGSHCVGTSAGGRDEAGRTVGHRHDGDHGIDAGRAGKRTPVGDEQTLDGVGLVIGTDHRRGRVVAHPAGPRLMEAEVAHLARAVAVAVDLVHEPLDAATLTRPVRDIRALPGENLSRAPCLHDLDGRLDTVSQVRAVVCRGSIIDARGYISR